MARRRDPGRFGDLVRAAIQAFLEAGSLGRTQVDDVARILGVAKGTVYLWVESKEALFDLALRYSDFGGEIAAPTQLPVKAPPWSETLAAVAERAKSSGVFPILAKASKARATPERAELISVLEEIFRVMDANKVAIRLVNSTARDLPDLGKLWFEETRGRLVDDLERYLGRLDRAGRLAPTPDPAISARIVIETNLWFAVHRHFDPRPLTTPRDRIEATVVQTLARGLWRTK
jgi:AcrR family transcriptional regulator